MYITRYNNPLIYRTKRPSHKTDIQIKILWHFHHVSTNSIARFWVPIESYIEFHKRGSLEFVTCFRPPYWWIFTAIYTYIQTCIGNMYPTINLCVPKKIGIHNMSFKSFNTETLCFHKTGCVNNDQVPNEYYIKDESQWLKHFMEPAIFILGFLPDDCSSVL